MYLDNEWSWLQRSLEISWLIMWKNPQSLQALEREVREDGCIGCEMSKIGRSA